ncbi:methyltransferase domain-containing protein [Sansalvadorimonas sp. 2012CJ34-2]|uniref:Methyltransferase domain-containing protein n=1 Tax=Parendozoicomonas callyspongiae TaxID=2942213 RepID=A0ABT0PB08_9GAMM|nr:class I SAM-dependent methyltransferase [Sansalvadorimonas sp. 2012CJ34-2]MCL6268416.1 methyltransferase domain-containing protein [Sansalvadorimonas sp. 2012CJ34-2]
MEFKGDLPELFTKAVEGDISYIFMRDLPALLKKHACTGNMALDYGCGTGVRLPFLKDQGFNVEGVDIEPDMLNQARQLHPEFSVTHIKSGNIPKPDNCFDLVFCSYVLLMIPTKAEMYQVMAEIYRVLKPGGVFVLLTAAENIYDHSRDWLLYEPIDYQPYPPTSGSTVKVKVRDSSLVFEDYYWTTEDYRSVFHEAGFVLEEHIQPLGYKGEYLEWKDELEYPNNSTFILRKPAA